MLELCDFQHFGEQGASKTTNVPLGSLMVSTMGAKRPLFYQKGLDFMKLHEASVNSMKVHELHDFYDVL